MSNEIMSTFLGPAPSVTIRPQEGIPSTQIRAADLVTKLHSTVSRSIQTITLPTKVAHPTTFPSVAPFPLFTGSSDFGITPSASHSIPRITQTPTVTLGAESNTRLSETIVPLPSGSGIIPSHERSFEAPGPSHGAIAIGAIASQDTIRIIAAHSQSATLSSQDASGLPGQGLPTTTAPQNAMGKTGATMTTSMAETLVDSATTSSEPLATGVSTRQDNATKIGIIIPSIVAPIIVIILLGLCLWRRRRHRITEILMAASTMDPYTLSVERSPTRTNPPGTLKGIPISQERRQNSFPNPRFERAQTLVAQWLQPHHCRQPRMAQDPALSTPTPTTTHFSNISLSELERGRGHNPMDIPLCGQSLSPQEVLATPSPSGSVTRPNPSLLRPLINPVFSLKGQIPEYTTCHKIGEATQFNTLKEKIERLEAAFREGNQRGLLEIPNSVDVEPDSDEPPAYTSGGNIAVSEK